MKALTINPTGLYLSLVSDTKALRFHAMWLRDNANDPDTRSVSNGQRLITLQNIPKQTHIVSASLEDDHITVEFAPEGKTIRFDLAWLEANAYDTAKYTTEAWIDPQKQMWDASLMKNIPEADFQALTTSNAALTKWLGSVSKFGFAKMVNGPVEDGALFKLVDLFGYVRETNYGRHFDVRTEVNPTNLAFTGLGLQAHTDNPYRDPVPSLQVLYCLESSAAGGDNMVVDGFSAALKLRQENTAYFDVLAEHCARFKYAGDKGVCLTSRKPMIELAADGELIGVRFNNRSLSAVTDVPFEKMELFYDAYRRFGEILEDQSLEVSFRLNPGEAFIVDNTRVLHARKGYSGEGSRWLQGCYADKDGLQSTLDSLIAQQSLEPA